jgi:hypothetical protein
MRTLIRAIVPGLVLGVLLPVSCGNDNNGPPPMENAGAACSTAATCYPHVDGGALKGTVTCLTKVTGGYCTHTCTQDSDCCAVPGECHTGLHEVCAPLENDPTTYCFISCEQGDIIAGYNDTNFCQSFATSVFGCRASGGGNPRKVCLP